jgi:quinol monooxygenase YgiN
MNMKTPMIHATTKIVLARTKIEDAAEILIAMAARIRSLPGCLGCELYQNVINSNVMVFEADWEREKDLDRHIASDEYRNLLLVMEMASRPPDVKFIPISESSGMERIVRLRSGST